MRQRLQILEDQKHHLADEAATHRTLSLIVGQLSDFAEKVTDRLAEADWHLRRDLIRLLVKRVEIDHQQVNIVFRVAPIGPAPNGPSEHNDDVLPYVAGVYGSVRGVRSNAHSYRNSDNVPTRKYIDGSEDAKRRLVHLI